MNVWSGLRRMRRSGHVSPKFSRLALRVLRCNLTWTIVRCTTWATPKTTAQSKTGSLISWEIFISHRLVQDLVFMTSLMLKISQKFWIAITFTQQNLQQPQPVLEPRMDWQQQMQQQLRYGQTGPLQSHGAPQYSSRYPEQQHYPHIEQGHGASSWSASQAPQVGVQPENQRPKHALQSSGATNPFSQLLVETPSTKSEVTAASPTKRSDPRTLKVSDLESFDVSDVVKSLYDDYPFQCKTDGKRFKSKEVLEKHLDR